MKRFIVLALAATLSAAAIAQDWQRPYFEGLTASKARNWSVARADFVRASKARPGDSLSVTLSGTSYQQRVWRQGAPYSPDFLAAYCGLKEAIAMPPSDLKTTLLSQVKAEFEELLSRREYCPEIFFFLDETYTLTSQTDKRMALGKQYSQIGSKADWKIDQEGIAPEDVEMVGELPGSSTADSVGTTSVSSPKTTFGTPSGIQVASYSQGPAVSTAREYSNSLNPSVVTVVVHQVSTHEPEIGQTTPSQSTPTNSTPNVPTPSQSAVSTSAQATLVKPTPRAPATVVLAQGAPAKPAAPVVPPAQVQPQPTTPSVSPSATNGSAPDLPATQSSAAGQPDPKAKPTKEKHKRDKRKNDKKDATAKSDSTVLVASNQTPTGSVAPAAVLVKPVSVKDLTHHSKDAAVISGSVPSDDKKFAIIIGNSESKMEGGAVPYASDDAQRVRQALINDAGYVDANVEVVINATAAQIADSVNALASRVPDKGAVFIYFTGVGTNVDGKDYLAGVDSDASNDSSTMVAKDDIYKAFMVRGARVFAFYQANRPLQEGHYFGSEVPMVGSISQMEATLPGDGIYDINADGKQIGLFTEAFVSVLKDIRSNQTPIMDFGWQVFYKLRTGGTGSSGGSSNQSPSLPVLTNMAADARF